MKVFPLPPLNSLVAFEAAARHLSFTLAAEELYVTQGAISRQIRILEEYLGKPLFIRVGRNVRLTPTGQQYARAIRVSLMDIAVNTEEVSSRKGPRQITLATSNAMASLWLLPKIKVFERGHDEVEFRIVVLDQVRDLDRVEWDIALFYCRNLPPDMQAATLFLEEVFPVCSPGYLERYGPLDSPDALLGCTLLSQEEADQDWMSWRQWFSNAGIVPGMPRRRLHINNYAMLVQAAVMDQGVALGWSQLVDDHLLQGTLVRPLDTVVRTGVPFFLLEHAEFSARRHACIHTFREWLLNTIPKEVGDLGLQ